MRDYAVIDVESGGLNPDVHSLLSVGVVIVIDGNIVETDEFFIRHDKYTVTTEALKVNGIDLVDIELKGISTTDAWIRLEALFQQHFGDAPVVLAGHNVNFDRWFIIKQIYDGVTTRFSHRVIDTVSALRLLQFAGKFPEGSCSSDAAFEYFGIHRPTPHNAGDDSIATKELIDCIVDAIK